MKRNIFIFGVFIASLILLCGCSTTPSSQTPTPTPTDLPPLTDTQTSLPTESVTTVPATTDDGSRQITITYRVETTMGGTIEGSTTQQLLPEQPSTKVVAVPSAGYEFLYWSDGSTNPVREGDVSKKDKIFSATFKMKVDDITVPTISITTNDSKWITKKEYVGATVTVSGTDNGEFDGTFTTMIKGRGNSSWNGGADITKYDSKNSYRLKLDEKQKFLGIGDSKNRDWVLNSCKFDASLLRNWIGYEMGEMLSGIDYSTECTWAHVYLNGDYRGVYMVAEHLEVANDRVDIDDKIEAADNGFFVELDMRGDKEGVLGYDYFYIDGFAEEASNKREWVIKSDLSENAEIAKQQHEFIKNYITLVHAAMTSGNREEIEKLVDIDSLVDMFICSEFSKDVDVGTASFYMYKEAGGKLHFTAPWDYDFAFGTYGEAISFRNLVSESSGANPWFCNLLFQKWFMELVYQRLLEIEEDVFHLINKTVAVGEKLTAASDKNDEKWGVYGNHYHQYVSYDTSADLYCYEDHLIFLEHWMTKRWENLKGCVNFYVEYDVNDM